MSPRHSLAVKRLPINDLPIFPFLAPRIFKPWPRKFSAKRTFTTIQAEIRKSRNEDTGIISPASVGNGFDGSTTRIVQACDFEEVARTRTTAVKTDRNFKGGMTPQTVLQSDANYMNEGSVFSDKADDLQRAYQQIWQPKSQMKTLPSSVVWEGHPIEKGPEIHQSFVHNAMTISSSVDSKTHKPINQTQRVLELALFPERLATNDQESKRVARSQHKARHRWLAYRSKRYAANKLVTPVRVKYKRLAVDGNSALNLTSSAWSSDFAKLSRKFDKQLSGREVPRTLRVRIAKQVQDKQSFIKSLANTSCEAFSQEWQALSTTEREGLWLEIMLVLLHKNPNLALKFILATFSKPYPPSYAISDSLEYITCYFLYEVKHPNPKNVSILFDTIMQLLNHVDEGYFHLTQKTVFWLMKQNNTELVEQLYSVLVRSKHPIHENTLLHFTDIFARIGSTDLAVKALRQLYENGADFSKPQVESVCATLLQRRHRNTSDNMLSDSKLFALMLELGLRPNIIFYNILLQNALEAADPDTAWQIHDMMLENGVTTDHFTYSILLNDAKLRMDRATIERILQIVTNRQIRNKYLVTDLLHAIFLLHEQDQKDRATYSPLTSPFERMLPLYSEYFDIRPLKDLITQAHRDVILETSTPKMKPPRETLIVMFIALLKGFTNPNSAPEWYQRFRQMVLNGNPEVLPLVESTHIYDAVIMCLGRWPGTLHLCTKVISDMFFSYSKTQGRTENITNVSKSTVVKSFVHSHCLPSIRTWSILLKAFMDHNQPRAAEKVLTMMRGRGIIPNQVTWNSLAIGYARQQDIAGTVNAIERLENEGWEVNDVTMRGLQWIQNREALVQALQQKNRRQRVRTKAKVEGVNGNLAADVDGMIKATQHLYPTEKPSRHRGRHSPKPLTFAPGDFSFPVGTLQPKDVQSDISGSQEEDVSEPKNQSTLVESEEVNPLAETWTRGWI